MACLQRTPRELLFLWFAMKRCSVRRVIIVILIKVIQILRRRARRMLREPSACNPILAHSDGTILTSDTAHIEQLRMDPHTYNIPCLLVREIGGSRDTKSMAVEEMVATSKGPGDDGGNDKSEGDKSDDVSVCSSTQAIKPSGSRGHRKRKRDVENEMIGSLSKALTSLIEVQKESILVMHELKKLFMRDVEIGEKRTKLFQALSALGALSPDEIVEALTSIGLNDKKVDLFFSMPDEFKLIFVKSQLKK